MASANTDMVDTFFIIKFMLKMSETNDINLIVSSENMKKIMELFNAKVFDENSKMEIVKYKTNQDLYAIADPDRMSAPALIYDSFTAFLPAALLTLAEY